MSIDKSKIWHKSNEDSIEYEFDDCDDLLVEDSSEENLGLEGYIKPPLFDKNLYLDKDMYDGFTESKGDKSETLKYLSTTSMTEDNLFIKLSLLYVLMLVIVCILEIFYGVYKGMSINFLGGFRYVICCLLTFIAYKLLNVKRR